MYSQYKMNNLCTRNDLLMRNLMTFYDRLNLPKMMTIVNGESKISLRIIDWFVTNYAKKNFIIYDVKNIDISKNNPRFKVYHDYKLKLKAYSKRNFDPFCRWERVTIPYDDNNYIETTIGQLNFFKWAIENKIVEYIDENYIIIENDMNQRNSTSKKRTNLNSDENVNGKTRKKREELSISAVKCIKKENVKIIVNFSVNPTPYHPIEIDESERNTNLNFMVVKSN